MVLTALHWQGVSVYPGAKEDCFEREAMNQLTGQKNVVLDRLQQLITTFSGDGPLVQQIMNARLHPTAEAQRQAMRTQIVDQLRQAYATEAASPKTEPWYAPQNSTIALVQAAME